MSTSNTLPRLRPRSGRGGFTLIEILVVIVIIAILAALLLPAINGAIIKAREASVSAEENQMAQALADFKSRYGDYPPSRFLCIESGNYTAALQNTSTTAFALVNTGWTSSPADISVAQLASRSLLALRKFWPRAAVVTTNASATLTIPGGFYDFNGNGYQDPSPYVLDGRECLTFFLGGVPSYGAAVTNSAQDATAFAGGMSGFSRNPLNPFQNNIAVSGNANYSNNRTAPLFEFNGGRLQMVTEELGATPARTATGVPAYFDPNSSTTNPSFYAYFSAYGGPYDPNDVNSPEPGSTSSPEQDVNGNAISLLFPLSFNPSSTSSPAPNPYTSTDVGGSSVAVVTYLNPQSFQIISPGADAHYGTGGQYVSNADIALPDIGNSPAGASTASTNPNDRSYEADNVTNFHQGRLQ